MNSSTISALENIYISPLELCNLNCKFCYTHKTKSVLTNDQILSFVKKYNKHLKTAFSPVKGRCPAVAGQRGLKSITFCGGEVFLLPDFPQLVNQLTSQGIFISIITNGTIDKLDNIANSNSVQLLVSLDGPREIHDANRGTGNFNKSIRFIKKALSLGFHVEIFFLITKNSYPFRDIFSKYLSKALKLQSAKALNITYLTDRLMSLSKDQLLDIKTNYPTYPNKDFGCFQPSLQSDSLIYGCCESPTPIAKISDPISNIIDNFTHSLKTCTKCPIPSCFGCSDPNFLCNYKKELQQVSCKDVVKSFNG
jgi:sulfatase maturation enzyme AslB (radical SAM superfamily)